MWRRIPTAAYCAATTHYRLIRCGTDSGVTWWEFSPARCIPPTHRYEVTPSGASVCYVFDPIAN